MHVVQHNMYKNELKKKTFELLHKLGDVCTYPTFSYYISDSCIYKHFHDARYCSNFFRLLKHMLTIILIPLNIDKMIQYSF